MYKTINSQFRPTTNNGFLLLMLILFGIIQVSAASLVTVLNTSSTSDYNIQLDQMTMICNHDYECETGQNATFAGIRK